MKFVILLSFLLLLNFTAAGNKVEGSKSFASLKIKFQKFFCQT